MKKVFTVVLALVLSVSLLSSCNKGGKPTHGDNKGSGFSVVTTIFPEYDWAREVLGDKADEADITLLQDNGADLHSYQPSVEDIMKISTCDVLVYVGGESDEWVDEIVEKSINPKTKIINLMDVLGDSAKEEEVVEGMQETEHDHDEEPEYDEHVWLSLRNAEAIVNAMADVFAVVDEKNGKEYEKNAEQYIEKLNALDGEYSDAVKSGSQKTLLFGDRFPFRYMTDDYGLKYYAAFVGCSAETEASFDTVTFLAEKVDELGLTHVMVIDGSDAKIAETVIKNTKNKNQEILTLDSMQTIATKEIEGGKTYLGIMEDNLEVLKKALS